MILKYDSFCKRKCAYLNLNNEMGGNDISLCYCSNEVPIIVKVLNYEGRIYATGIILKLIEGFDLTLFSILIFPLNCFLIQWDVISLLGNKTFRTCIFATSTKVTEDRLLLLLMKQVLISLYDAFSIIPNLFKEATKLKRGGMANGD